MKKRYAWIICACCLLMHFCGCGLVATTLSVCLPQLRTVLGLNNVETSMVTTLRCLSTTAFMAVAGIYFKKLSLRLGVSVATLFLAVGCVLISAAKSVWLCYLAAAMMGVSYALAAMLPLTLIINNWFHSDRSTALAIAACGSSLCTVAAPPALTCLIERIGMRRTLAAEAAAVVLVAVLLFLLLRDRPADMGLEPYQRAARQGKNKRTARGAGGHELSQGGLLALLGAMFLVGMSGSPYLSSLTLHLTTEGYSGMQAASALSLLGGVMAGGKLLFGVLSDRIGTYWVNYIALGSWAVGAMVTVLAAGGNSMPLVYISSVLGGLGLPIGSIGMTVWAGDLVSQEQYARTVRLGQTAFTAGTLLGTPITGVLADLFHGYAAPYIMYGVFFAVILAVVQTLYHRQEGRVERKLPA